MFYGLIGEKLRENKIRQLAIAYAHIKNNILLVRVCLLITAVTR